MSLIVDEMVRSNEGEGNATFRPSIVIIILIKKIFNKGIFRYIQ